MIFSFEKVPGDIFLASYIYTLGGIFQISTMEASKNENVRQIFPFLKKALF
jgi:hypothetical protein